MAKAINNAVIRGYLRRGLIEFRFTEEENAVIERRLLVDELRAVFIVPWRYVENRTAENDNKAKTAFNEAARAVYSIRTDKARQMRAARQHVSISDV